MDCTLVSVSAQQPVEHFKHVLQNITTDRMLLSVLFLILGWVIFSGSGCDKCRRGGGEEEETEEEVSRAEEEPQKQSPRSRGNR